jgi:adenosine deaminase
MVQKKMQWMIGQKGIGIETNPSSNMLIGTFKRYDKHPILNWYNNGLATNPEEIQSVPQLQVSINTDDQGVFATYIENEYAYLALALEKMKDEAGNPRYSRTLIYQWLDNVRKMGLEQSFMEPEQL